MRTTYLIPSLLVLLAALVLLSPLAAQSTTRVNVDSSGAQGNGNSLNSSSSSNGRYVVLESSATNLVSGDTNGVANIYAHDRQTGTTVRASVDSSGTQGNGASTNPIISASGRYVA